MTVDELSDRLVLALRAVPDDLDEQIKLLLSGGSKRRDRAIAEARELNDIRAELGKRPLSSAELDALEVTP